MAMTEDFLSLDSHTEGILFDIYAFREWQSAQNNEPVEVEEDLEARQQLYEQMKTDAIELYGKLIETAYHLPSIIKIRLFRYLQGESMDEIGQSESPPVTRQAIHKSLLGVLNAFGTERVKQIWEYGKMYLQ